VIIYIHGFGSSGQGGKASTLRALMPNLIAPSLSIIPDLAISTLCELIEGFLKHEKVYLIGSSLGGYYSLYLSQKYNIPTVLINPAIYPYNTVERALGFAPDYYNLSSSEWRGMHLNKLREYEIETINPNNVLLLLQKGDELLDYREAEARFPLSKHIIEEDGNHSFVGIERYVDVIEDFFKSGVK
jgi:uncharacterized protein